MEEHLRRDVARKKHLSALGFQPMTVQLASSSQGSTFLQCDFRLESDFLKWLDLARVC